MLKLFKKKEVKPVVVATPKPPMTELQALVAESQRLGKEQDAIKERRKEIRLKIDAILQGDK